MIRYIKEELIDSEIGHLPFLWPIAVMMELIFKLIDKCESPILVILIVIFLGFPAIIIWGFSAVPLLILTPFWWLILAKLH